MLKNYHWTAICCTYLRFQSHTHPNPMMQSTHEASVTIMALLKCCSLSLFCCPAVVTWAVEATHNTGAVDINTRLQVVSGILAL